MRAPLTVGELFAGIGGFGLGFRRAGFDHAFLVEWDGKCQEVLARQFPGVPLFADVRDVGSHNLPPCDVLTFGSPCQDLSVAGRRAGFDGERSGLFFEAVRIIRELRERDGRPTITVWENVPGAFTSNRGRDFAAALDHLADVGAMDLAWRVLDARYFGLAQKRRRVFLVGDFAGERAVEVLFEPASVCGDPSPSGEEGEDATGEAQEGTRDRRDLDVYVPDLAGTLTREGACEQSWRGDGSDTLIATLASEPLAFDRQSITSPTNRSRVELGAPAPTLSAEPPMIAVEECDTDELASALTARDGKGGASYPDGSPQGCQLIRGRVRRLTPTECARLQGFPDDWNNWIGDSARYRQFGNAVAVNVSEWIARRIAGALGASDGQAKGATA